MLRGGKSADPTPEGHEPFSGGKGKKSLNMPGEG